MEFLAIDPGTHQVGWAGFDSSGETIGFGVIKGEDAFLDWLEEQPRPRVIIIEGYFINPYKHKTWSKAGTSEVIGAIKRYARKHGIEIVEQRNTDLPTGLRFIGMYGVYYKDRKNIKHVDDEISALAHGTVYLVRNKIKQPPDGTKWL